MNALKLILMVINPNKYEKQKKIIFSKISNLKIAIKDIILGNIKRQLNFLFFLNLTIIIFASLK